MRLATLLLLSALLVGSAAPLCFSQSIEQVLVVHEDGSAVVYVYVSSIPENREFLEIRVVSEPITVSIYGCPGASAYAGNESIVVYAPNCTRLTVRYVTISATSKNGSVWTLRIRTPYPTTILLPRSALPIDIEPSPSPTVVNGTPALSFPPGQVLVKYVEIPSYVTKGGSNANTVTNPLSTAPSPPSFANPRSLSPNTTLVIGGVAAGLAGAAIALRLYRSFARRKRIELDELDRRIVEALRSRGELTARELMELTRIPKSTLYRRLAKLREKGVVESVVKSGTTFYRLKLGEG